MNRPTNSENPIAPLALDRVSLAAALQCSARHVDELDRRGLLPRPIVLSDSASRAMKRWPTALISAWLAAGAPPRREWESMQKPLQMASG